SKCSRKVGALDIGDCRVFASERSRLAQVWIFGAKLERVRKYNWRSQAQWLTKRYLVAPRSKYFQGPEVMNDPHLIRILAVDDHPLLRKGIAALVNTEDDMKMIAEAS